MQVKYKEEIVSALMERFKYRNIMEVPKLDKIVINIGLGSAKDNPKACLLYTSKCWSFWKRRYGRNFKNRRINFR